MLHWKPSVKKTGGEALPRPFGLFTNQHKSLCASGQNQGLPRQKRRGTVRRKTGPTCGCAVAGVEIRDEHSSPYQFHPAVTAAYPPGIRREQQMAQTRLPS